MATGEPKLAVVVQARMSSRRLPGKVLRPLAGRPLLAHALERLRRGQSWPVVVATSTHPSDDALAMFCRDEGVPCLRGPLENVAARFLWVADSLGLEAFVRVCGDSPLLDPALVRQGVDLFVAERPDLAGNVFPRSFPQGQSVEVVAVEALRRALPRFEEEGDREHVTPYFYRHARDFRIANFLCHQDLSGLRLVVDTASDLARLEGLMQHMETAGGGCDLKRLVALYSQAQAGAEGEVGDA